MSARLFDELTQIQHSSPSMQLTKYFCLAFVCLALAARAQEKQPPTTASPPPQSAQAASETRKTRVLTIQEAIQLALEHNLDIQITRYQPQFDQYALNIAFAAWEPAFNFSASHTYDASPGFPTSSTTPGSRESWGSVLTVAGGGTKHR